MKNNHPVIDALLELKNMYLEQLRKATDEREKTFIRHKLQELDNTISATQTQLDTYVIPLDKTFPHYMFNQGARGVGVRVGCLESIKRQLMADNTWLINYANYDQLATYFATIYIDYSDHDKRDLEIRLNHDFEHNDKIQWAIFAPDEIVASGELLLDRCTINPNASEEI